ncbi:MAG: M56 family metallopeptidase [Sphingomonas sp.]
MLLVLALRGPVRKAFGPHIAYALWALPVLRMLMPRLPGDWQLTRLIAPLNQQAADAPGVAFGVMNPATLSPAIDPAVVVHTSFEFAGHHTAVALVPPTTVAGGPSIAVLLLGLWAVGAIVFLAYHLIAHGRFCRHLLERARIDRTVAEGRVRVIETDAAHGPLAFGIWRKYVAFPRDFSERYDALERDLALAHELGHHVRGDLIANWVALVVLALHWFNPVAWRAFRAFRADQEMACDALVLAGRAQALRHAYGRAIVKSAHGGAVSAACHLHTINELKGRLRMLSKTRNLSPTRIAAGMVGVSALSLAALGLTASGTQAAERIKTNVERVTGVDLTGQTAPTPPRRRGRADTARGRRGAGRPRRQARRAPHLSLQRRRGRQGRQAQAGDHRPRRRAGRDPGREGDRGVDPRHPIGPVRRRPWQHRRRHPRRGRQEDQDGHLRQPDRGAGGAGARPGVALDRAGDGRAARRARVDRGGAEPHRGAAEGGARRHRRGDPRPAERQGIRQGRLTSGEARALSRARL